jgi:hypothetical protein
MFVFLKVHIDETESVSKPFVDQDPDYFAVTARVRLIAYV